MSWKDICLQYITRIRQSGFLRLPLRNKRQTRDQVVALVQVRRLLVLGRVHHEYQGRKTKEEVRKDTFGEPQNAKIKGFQENKEERDPVQNPRVRVPVEAQRKGLRVFGRYRNRHQLHPTINVPRNIQGLPAQLLLRLQELSQRETPLGSLRSNR